LVFNHFNVSLVARHFRYEFAALKRAQALPKQDHYPMNSLERLIEKADQLRSAIVSPFSKSPVRSEAVSAWAIGGNGSRSVRTSPMSWS
jgi:hypothetical protein